MEPKLALGMIVFNGMPFLPGVLETFEPYVDQIVVAEGPVRFWQDRDYTRSDDGTVECLEDYQTRWGWEKLRFTRGPAEDKLQMCNDWMRLLRDDITHVACMDADEFMLPEDIIRITNLMYANDLDSVGLRLRSFVGGFDHYISGFEEKQDTIRFLKRRPGATFSTHRPPTLEPGGDRHLSGHVLAEDWGIYLYHYSHVLALQVRAKEAYYAGLIGPQNTIPNYYKELWLPWVMTGPTSRLTLENAYHGIHDFAPSYRGAAYSREYDGPHPRWIEDNKYSIMRLQKEQINAIKEEEEKERSTIPAS